MVVAQRLMSVLGATSVIAQQLDLVRERAVIRRDCPSLSICAKVLRGIKAETRRMADRSYPAISEPGAVCLAGILDHHQSTRRRDAGERIQVGRLAIEVDGDDSLRM